MGEQPTRPSFFPITISRIITETEDVKTFFLDTNQKLSYSSGQYLTFIFTVNGQELRRSYSISSSPLKNEPLSITFRRIPNGVISRILFDQYKEGDILYTSGPAGFFVLSERKTVAIHYFFFAAGTGIVPVFSLMKTLMIVDQFSKAVLIYSNKSPSQCIYLEHLKLFEKAYSSRLTIHFLFSNDPLPTKARLNTFLLEDLLQLYEGKKDENLFYLCGPPSYMRMVEFELRTSGIPQTNIRKEYFDTAKPLISQTPPDVSPHQVEIHVRGEIHHLHVRYPVSILAEAKRNKIDLPYSCEAGKCGNCVAKCLKGRVWMLYNEVLTDKDLENGLVLTCNSFPIEGDITISF